MEVEDGHPGLRLRGKSAPVQQLALEGNEEALAQGGVLRGASSRLQVLDRAPLRMLAAALKAPAQSLTPNFPGWERYFLVS
jgi:hypothetical protein